MTEKRGNAFFIIEKIKGLSGAKQFDVFLFAGVLAITAIGYYFLYIVSQTLGDDATGARMLQRQLFSIVIGVVCALALSSIDYKYYRIPSYIAYIGSILLLIVVLLMGVGENTAGSKSWLNLPIIGSFQPAELTKITFVVVIATFLERISQKEAEKLDYVKLVFYSVLPIGLILWQGDAGTAIVFVIILCVMLFAFGIKYRYILIAMGAVLASLPFLWFFVMGEYQKMRILTFLNPELDRMGKGLQVIRSKTAIGAGQLFGRQIEDVSQAQFARVPARATDFIFTAIAEKAGFIGSVAFVLLIVLVLVRCFYIASKARDRYGSYMVVGMTGMLAFHFVENIGMCLGILPVTGIPLPFVSQGGTAMIANYFAVGIILSVSMTREKAHYRQSEANNIVAVPKSENISFFS